ncbi:uncharacterized protein (DUF169 family) [Mycobacterium frederiksbergense]|uniref:Uncharacterized protein (DUF169 family) n=1 Tax=Mycolicibacterium frederiksbergense TaxID=117567 RepID=A0ABT6KTT9_9MYCO|nr:DUF169 domain-containing protein [Mycolicibacterium frederiksbergense]MDH6194129.1 uncharacterized protein (DUF169 family) [Mycolicibacterium frederiksbergense]
MDCVTIAERLTALLDLRHRPIGLAFVDQPPQGVAQSSRPVPSACTFWRQAEQAVFYASAEQHFNCPIGAMVMGFTLPPTVRQQLSELVQSMCDARYLGADEAAGIPSADHSSAGIVYGPLSQLPLEPDLVLTWLNVNQAMLYAEAAGRAAWTGVHIDVTGRPGCAALPRALQNNQPGMSMGCAGMRTFTTIGDDMNLAVIPGHTLARFVDELAQTVNANATMRSFYSAQKAAVTG